MLEGGWGNVKINPKWFMLEGGGEDVKINPNPIQMKSNSNWN